jgi:hypothetical protein
LFHDILLQVMEGSVASRSFFPALAVDGSSCGVVGPDGLFCFGRF